MAGLNTRGWLTVAFIAGFLATGLPYWPVPYEKLSLPNTLLEKCLVPIAVAAVVIPLVSGLGIARSAVAVGIGVPAAVFARVVADGLRDATSHNLWPIEVIIALVVGMAVAWPGAAIGRLLRHIGGRIRRG